jgi:hypothetical protein
METAAFNLPNNTYKSGSVGTPCLHISVPFHKRSVPAGAVFPYLQTYLKNDFWYCHIIFAVSDKIAGLLWTAWSYFGF